MVTHTHKTFTINNVVATTIKIVRSNFFSSFLWVRTKMISRKAMKQVIP